MIISTNHILSHILRINDYKNFTFILDILGDAKKKKYIFF